MSRLDRKQGRFDTTYESVAMESALRDHQGVYGQSVDYFRFSHALSTIHDVYDEATEAGRVFYEPVALPVLSVTRTEGTPDQTSGGLYWTDRIHLTASFRQLLGAGLSRLDIEHGRYVRDRFVYDERVFRVSAIHVLGQVRARDVIVAIDAVQLKPEDLRGDEQFSAWWGRENSRDEPSGPPFQE
ncbi:hypothetical protein ACWDTT_10590 [Streptosporangium sandarakinum]